jgi:hypothetical protein
VWSTLSTISTAPTCILPGRAGWTRCPTWWTGSTARRPGTHKAGGPWSPQEGGDQQYGVVRGAVAGKVCFALSVQCGGGGGQGGEGAGSPDSGLVRYQGHWVTYSGLGGDS